MNSRIFLNAFNSQICETISTGNGSDMIIPKAFTKVRCILITKTFSLILPSTSKILIVFCIVNVSISACDNFIWLIPAFWRRSFSSDNYDV